MNLYQQYLVADKLMKRVQSISYAAEIQQIGLVQKTRFIRDAKVNVHLDWPYAATNADKWSFVERYQAKYGTKSLDNSRLYTGGKRQLRILEDGGHTIWVGDLSETDDL